VLVHSIRIGLRKIRVTLNDHLRRGLDNNDEAPANAPSVDRVDRERPIAFRSERAGSREQYATTRS